MVQSMTGFGKAEAIIKSKKIVVELRALNSKTLDLNLKYPEFLGDVDLLIRKNVSNVCFHHYNKTMPALLESQIVGPLLI